jgi:hypothetical protein
VRELKNMYQRRISEDLEKIFKSFSSLYNKLKIKNKFIINILFPFYTKTLSKNVKAFSFFLSLSFIT